MSTETETTTPYITQMRFTHALAIVRAIPQNSTLQPMAADKLQFYGLYKQATEGDVNIPRPSSRQVVEYAKWKAWCRMKGMSPTEAQKLYAESLIQLLTELVHRYPHHEQLSFLKKALHSLEFDQKEQEEDLFQDAYDPTEFEFQQHFLNHIEPDQLMRQDIPNSSPSTRNNNHIKYYNPNLSDITTTDYLITPITSPGQNSVTGQWVLNQLQQQQNVRPMDFLQEKQDILSEADTIDREVAAVTSNLVLSSPRQSPYSSSTHLQQPPPQQQQTHHKHSPSLSMTSSKKSKNKKADNTRALEKLQTEVTALTEQIDRLRQSIKSSREQKESGIPQRVIKTLIKHLMANSAILLIVFYILLKRKSPIAYSITNYFMPMFQELIRKIIRKVVFWKITV